MFSMAHYALANAFRHAGRSGCWWASTSDGMSWLGVGDGVGLPDDYEERGHGFENMRAVRRASGRTAYRRATFGRGMRACLRDARLAADERLG